MQARPPTANDPGSPMDIEAAACADPHHCVTCGDDGVPMRVLDLDEAAGLARCSDEQGARVEVEIALVESLAVGDRVLVHAGVALTRLRGGVSDGRLEEVRV